MTKKDGENRPFIIPAPYGTAGTVWREQPLPDEVYGPIDTDLARDNLENDIPFADLQDL